MEKATNYRAFLGEGALWNDKTRSLYWVDIDDKKFMIFDPENDKNSIFSFEQQVGTVVPTDRGRVLVALEDGIYDFNPETHEQELLAANDNSQATRFNDGKCDPEGRFWVGTMDRSCSKPVGTLYCLEGNGDFRLMEEKVTISNGIAWYGEKMYYIDTPTGQVAVYDYDAASGQISGRRFCIDIPKEMGSPDGCTIDVEGMLWIAHWAGGCVSRWNPANGKLLTRVEVPAKNVTSVAFGGAHLDRLYITTARSGLSAEEMAQDPGAGYLYVTDVGMKGVKAGIFCSTS